MLGFEAFESLYFTANKGRDEMGGLICGLLSKAESDHFPSDLGLETQYMFEVNGEKTHLSCGGISEAKSCKVYWVNYSGTSVQEFNCFHGSGLKSYWS